MKKIIIFDLDGVLINSISNMDYAWKKSCNDNNIKLLRTIGVVFSDDEKRVTQYIG